MKKNVLLIEPFLPFPLISGGHQAIYNGIAALKNIANVYVVYAHSSWVDHDMENRKQMEINLPFVKIFTFSTTEKSPTQFIFKALKKIKKITSRLSDGLKKRKNNMNWYRAWGFSPQHDSYADFINQLIIDYNIDIVQVEMCQLLSIVLDLPDNVRKIFVHHEIQFFREKLRLDNLNIPQSYRHEVTLHKFEEIGLLNMYDTIVVLSDIDKILLENAGVIKPIHTSFAVVNSNSDNHINVSKTYNMLSFVGPENHYPNKDGIIWFLDNCWPELLKKDSNLHLRIIGNWTPQTKKSFYAKYENIEFTGFVSDLAEAIIDTIMIVPIRIGSGIRMKILEAGSIGIPVVSTIVGAQGIPVENGISAFITDDPYQFVEYIITLKEQQTRSKIAQGLHNLVQAQYSFEEFAINRRNLYV